MLIYYSLNLAKLKVVWPRINLERQFFWNEGSTKLLCYPNSFQVGLHHFCSDYIKHAAGNILVAISNSLINFVRCSWSFLVFTVHTPLYGIIYWLVCLCCCIHRKLFGFILLSLSGQLYIQYQHAFIIILQLMPSIVLEKAPLVVPLLRKA